MLFRSILERKIEHTGRISEDRCRGSCFAVKEERHAIRRGEFRAQTDPSLASEVTAPRSLHPGADVAHESTGEPRSRGPRSKFGRLCGLARGQLSRLEIPFGTSRGAESSSRARTNNDSTLALSDGEEPSAQHRSAAPLRPRRVGLGCTTPFGLAAVAVQTILCLVLLPALIEHFLLRVGDRADLL